MTQDDKLKKIIDNLREKKQTITFAESCTSGLVAGAFGSISGVSDVFNGSVVTYSNEIKHLWLGVSSEILDSVGAVSSECVEQMLSGAKKMSNSSYALAVSGIAGPNGGSELKPVGTVFIGLSTPSNIIVKRCLFDGDREQIQAQSVSFAIDLLAIELKII